MKNGLFITFEGIEGTGKTTAVNFVKEFFHNSHKDVVFTREPGGTSNAEKIRKLLLGDELISPYSTTELMLMFASRVEHVESLIKPALQDGKIVVSDRFFDASYAYQGGGRGVDIKKIDQLRLWCLQDFVPDLTILLDAPIEVCLNRIMARGEKDRIEQENQEFFIKARQTYLRLAQNNSRFVIVDTNRPIKEIKVDIITIIEKTTCDFGGVL